MNFKEVRLYCLLNCWTRKIQVRLDARFDLVVQQAHSKKLPTYHTFSYLLTYKTESIQDFKFHFSIQTTIQFCQQIKNESYPLNHKQI